MVDIILIILLVIGIVMAILCRIIDKRAVALSALILIYGSVIALCIMHNLPSVRHKDLIRKIETYNKQLEKFYEKHPEFQFPEN